MGREIRRVPPNWNHPRKMYARGPGYQPMYDQTFAAAVAQWEEGRRKWDAGEDSDRGHSGWGIERARAFVAAGWAPSMMLTGGRLLQSSEIPLELAKNQK